MSISWLIVLVDMTCTRRKIANTKFDNIWNMLQLINCYVLRQQFHSFQMQMANKTANHLSKIKALTGISPSFSLHQPSSQLLALQQGCSIQGKIIFEPNIDAYVLEYNPQLKKYVIKSNQKTSQMKEIGDLVLGDLRTHVKTMGSMPNIWAHKIMKPIVMPIFDGKKFAFIFQTSDYDINGQANFAIRDKFYIFITDSFVPKTLSEFAKLISRKEIERKLKHLRQNVVSTQYNKLYLQDIGTEMIRCKKFYFSKEKDIQEELRMQNDWYFRNIHKYSILIRLNTLHYRPILLLTLLIFYAIREFKVIMVGYKTTRHIMSQAIMALKHAYHPIPYCYPIVLSAASDEHDDFIDSPVPALIAYWGGERQCVKIRERFKKLGQQKLIPTILIDLNSLTALSSITAQSESRILTGMNNFITSDKQKSSVISNANEYVFSLVHSKRQDLQQQSALFQKSLAFHQFANNNNK